MNECKNDDEQKIELNFAPEPIKTIFISPTKEMPLDVFKVFHRLAYFTELMDRVQGHRDLVLWDSSRESIYSESSAEAEWTGIQHDWFRVAFEIPKKVFDDFMSS